MSEQRSATSRPVIGYVLACYLIGSFLWRLLTPAHEYPMRSAQVLDIGLDILMIVGLFGVRAGIPKPLFWVSLIAGLGLFAIRLTSDASWWTGHLIYTLLPR
jgi:hypothetical protein